MKEYLEDCLVNYILKNYDKYKKEGFIIWAHDDYYRIKYNHKIYKVSIINENEKLYWKLRPYNKSYFTTEVKEYSSFENVIFAIKENDKIF